MAVSLAPVAAIATPATPEVHDAGTASTELPLGGPPPEERWAPDVPAGPAANARQAATAPPLEAGTGLTSYYSYEEFTTLGEGMEVQINIGTGNLFARSEIISLAGPGVPATVSAVHNSNSDIRGDIGNWSSDVNNLRLHDVDNAWVYHDGTGAKFPFSFVNGAWQSPAGVNATLAQNGTGMTLTYNRTGEKITFNSGGYPTARTDRNGVGVSYGYGTGYQAGKITSITDATGKTITGFYDPSDTEPLVRFRDSSNRRGLFTWYDTIGIRGDMSSYLMPDGRTAQMYTNQTDNTVNRIVIGDKNIEFDYDGRRVTAVTENKTGETPLVTTFTYEDGVTKVTDPRGNTSEFLLDDDYRVTAAIDQLDRHREQEWTPNGDIAMTTNGFAAGGEGAQTARTYDSLNNQTSVTLPTGAATQALYAQGPDCAGAQTSHPYLPKCTVDDAGNSESMTYDTAGNLTQRKNTTSGSAAETFTYTYGSTCGGMAGQICTAVDGNGKTTSYTYSNGLLIKVTPPAPLGATSYTHDALGRVATVTNGAGHKTTYAYDAFDRIVTTTYNNGATLSTVYNSDGSIKQETDSATGTAIAYTYNVLGFQTKQTTTSSTSGYNQMATMTYDANGNLTRVYDSVGAAETAYTYDAANQLTRAQLQGGNCTAANSPGCIRYEYDDNALEKARIFPFGARQDTLRDDSGRPTRITVKDKNGAVQNDIAYSYTHNGADSGSVRTRTSHKEQGITAGAVTTYGYDSRSRLTSAVEKTGTTSSASWTYQYDKADNRTRQVRAGATGATAGTINYTYDAASRLTGATGSTGAWSYDGAGNQTRNALTGVSSTYGDRLQATANGSTTYSTFGQGNDLQLKVGNNVQKYTTLGAYSTASDRTISRNSDGTAIATRIGTTWAYLTADHLGSTTGLVGADGAYLGGYSYSPYGETRSTSTNATVAGNTIRYIGQHLEPTTGLYKLGARYYDASLGRFTQMDPSGQERNPYIYAACDPVNALDPTGLNCTSAVLGALLNSGLAIAATVGLAASIAATITSAGAATPATIAAVIGYGVGVSGAVISIGNAVNECT